MAENVREFVDVLDGVFEGLYLGQRLSSLGVIWRQVVPKLVQGLGQTPHAQLLPLTGLHAPLGGHLGLAVPLRSASSSSSRVTKRKLFLLGSGGTEHLRRGAHGIHGRLRRARVFSEMIGFHFPLTYDLSCNYIHVHNEESEVRDSGLQVNGQSDVSANLQPVFL